MKLLLDTHIYIWWVNANKQLTKSSQKLIAEADGVYVSSASIWEATIKIGLGKLDADIDKLVDAITASGFIELPLTARHAAMAHQLPALHKDPFDRILIAQAISEPLTFLTADSKLADYSDLVTVI